MEVQPWGYAHDLEDRLALAPQTAFRRIPTGDERWPGVLKHPHGGLSMPAGNKNPY